MSNKTHLKKNTFSTLTQVYTKTHTHRQTLSHQCTCQQADTKLLANRKQNKTTDQHQILNSQNEYNSVMLIECSSWNVNQNEHGKLIKSSTNEP